MNDPWANGTEYEKFMGRWSFPAAKIFLNWLVVPFARNWLDVGCGTGTLTRLILESYQPAQITAVDSSEEFISYARKSINNPLVRFQTGLAQSLDLETHQFDAVVSGLVLNFVPQPENAIAEMIRVTRPGGKIGIFIWDYSEGMQMLRYFWDAAYEIDSDSREFDEGLRFPLCGKGQLEVLAERSGLKQIESTAIEIKTVFRNFNDYWEPFLSKVGPAPSYAMNLELKDRQRLENKLRSSLPTEENGSITLKARAWAIKCSVF